MGKVKIQLVLAKAETIASVQRHPGYVLLEGICPEGVTRESIDKAIQLKKIKVIAGENKAKEGKSEGSK